MSSASTTPTGYSGFSLEHIFFASDPSRRLRLPRDGFGSPRDLELCDRWRHACMVSYVPTSRGARPICVARFFASFVRWGAFTITAFAPSASGHSARTRCFTLRCPPVRGARRHAARSHSDRVRMMLADLQRRRHCTIGGGLRALGITVDAPIPSSCRVRARTGVLDDAMRSVLAQTSPSWRRRYRDPTARPSSPWIAAFADPRSGRWSRRGLARALTTHSPPSTAWLAIL